MRNVIDAIKQVENTIDVLIEVLRLEHETILVTRLSTVAEIMRGMTRFMKSTIHYSLSPSLDVRESLTIPEEDLTSSKAAG